MDENNLLQLDVLRVERHKPRKCVCKVRRFTIDTQNREITCGCGIVVDPFDAMCEVGTMHERANEQYKRMYNQMIQWQNEKPRGVMFKEMERMYKKGEMLPRCPSCNEAFDFKDLIRYTNKKFAKLEYRNKE